MRSRQLPGEDGKPQPGFLRELFRGRLRLDLVTPYPGGEERPEFAGFLKKLKTFLREKVDPVEIDGAGEYPPAVVEGLKQLGAFGMKIPKEYGGLGFTQGEYDRAMKVLGSHDASVTALLAAHQSIGVPQPVKLFGTDEQKKKYLPRCAAGSISGFALTEPAAGSDPSSIRTTVESDGDDYVLNGEKLWCTNGAIAEVLVVVARHPDSRKISAFIVETSSKGVEVKHRSRFMGMRAISNALLSFTGVRVPKGNLLGGEGQGLKVALATLNTGRLSLPAAAVGVAKTCLEVCRRWAGERIQWGRPIGEHEAIAHLLADMAADTFAMEAVCDLADALADRGDRDIRLEAAAVKEFNSARGWKVVDDAMQIRGGRGYETEASLAARGEPALPMERLMRDFRIHRVFEGSSEIMHLYLAREAATPHLQRMAPLADPAVKFGGRLAALPKIAGYYACWYAARLLGWSLWPRHAGFGRLAKHVRFVHRASKKLARAVFRSVFSHRGRLMRKQGVLFRLADVGIGLFAMTASVLRARAADAAAEEIADLFCRNTRRRIRTLFHELGRNDDDLKSAVGRRVLGGEHARIEEGALGVDRAPGDAG